MAGGFAPFEVLALALAASTLLATRAATAQAPDAGAGATPAEDSSGTDAAPEAAADPKPARAAPLIQPPQLIERAAAEYPAQARAEGRQGRVVLRLHIDATGRVLEADISETAGHGFDEAARAAALQCRFAPATRDGVAVPARILYTYTFELPSAAQPPASAPAVKTAAPLAAPRELSPSPAMQAAARPARPIAVTVHGATGADRLRESAEAVTVVETERAKRESADLGEVLRRTQGVGARRSGGLGSSTRFSLNGMTDEQIRFFIDGVPLDLSGFVDLSVVPVNLLERVEIYRGVVPSRFGVDALGGAVNLVTDDDYLHTRASASYQGGSFGTSRVTAAARHRFGAGPFVLSGHVFYDYADNDYPIFVEVPNNLGRLEEVRVHRFHDAYRALGASVEAGVLGLPWARRLLLRAYVTDSFKELQHNQVMSRPYGEVESGERVLGATLRYDQPLRFVPGLGLSALAAYAHRRIDFLDESPWVYDWFGQRIAESEPGEVAGTDDVAIAQDTTYLEHRGVARLGLSHLLQPEHALRLASTFNVTAREGENRSYQSERFLDPASAEQRLYTLVSGLDYELDAFSDLLENVMFAKHYFYALSAQVGRVFDRAPIEDGFATDSESCHSFGAGDALRVRLADWALAKASYEYAVRLPNAEEVFGNGRLILPNFELEPEISHNANLGLAVADLTFDAHVLRGELNGFLRDTDRLIQPITLGLDLARHHNIWSARSLGVEAALGWTSPGEYLWLDGNVTWVDLRNTSTSGEFADFRGDRIPNRPWLYANASARAQVSGVSAPSDELSLTWHLSYVHDFYRSWESAGRADTKLVIGAQLLHSLVLTYLVRGARSVSSTLEVQNLTDARAYDFFGVQRPGRAYYFKATLEL